MSQFSYTDYNNIVARASGQNDDEKRVGFFKLGENEVALVRFNISAIEDLHFATIHKPLFGKKFENCGTGYSGISCLNPIGSYGEACPLCTAAANGHPVVDKAKKVVFIPMLVAYLDASTGVASETTAVIWERPASFSRDLASKLSDYGNLKDTVFKVSRVGQGKETRYIIDFVPLYNKPELVNTDFSSLDALKINKHSYWEKTKEDLERYLLEGKFPEAVKSGSAPIAVNSNTAAPIPMMSESVAPAPAPIPAPIPMPTPVPMPTPMPTPAPAPAPAPANDLPWATAPVAPVAAPAPASEPSRIFDKNYDF